MYYLDQLTLKNVRSYRDQPSTIIFSPNLTIITGHNGAGKSTLLEALLYLLSQDRPVYDRIEPKGASDSTTMLMQCILRQGANATEENQEPIKDPKLDPPLKSSCRRKKNLGEISATSLKSNQILFELRRTIKRAEGSKTNASQRNRKPNSPELSSALQLYDGVIQYCLLCSVTKSNWMFATPEEISRSTDQILNVDRFTKLSKDLNLSTKESASSEACYTATLASIATQEETLCSMSEDISSEEEIKKQLQRDHDLLASISDEFIDFSATYTDVCELFEQSTTLSKDNQAIVNKHLNLYYAKLMNVPISAFLSNKTSTDEDSLLSYLTIRSGNNALLEIFKKVLKANMNSDSQIQLEKIKDIFSKQVHSKMLKEGVLLAHWEKLKEQYDPHSITNFIDKYKSVYTLLRSIKDTKVEAKVIVPESQNTDINRKYNLIESFYKKIIKFSGSFECNKDFDNIDAFEQLCLDLSMICMNVHTINDAINNNISQSQDGLKSIKNSIDILDTSIITEQNNHAAISKLVSLANTLSDTLTELQNLEYEEVSKRNIFQDLSTKYTNLTTSISQYQKAHDQLLYLYTNHYVSPKQLLDMKTNLINSNLLSYIPILLSTAMKQYEGREKDISTLCRFVFSTWEKNWCDLISSLESVGYPKMDTLMDITKRIPPNCLSILNDVLGFINGIIQDCISIEFTSFVRDSIDLSESLNKMVKDVNDALQKWLTATGNMVSVLPTLRNDFSIYINKRTELSESMSKNVVALFDDFLSGYREEAAQRKADLVKTIISMLTRSINLLQIAIECQNLNVSFDEVCTDLLELESIGSVLQKIIVNENEVSSSGNRADMLFYQMFYTMPGNTMICSSFPLLAPQLSYQSIDCLTIKDTINTFFDTLIVATTYLEEEYTNSQNELSSLKEQLNNEERGLTAAKQALQEAENCTKILHLNISELKQQFLATSIDGKPYSLDYAQKLSKQDIYISEKLKLHKEERSVLSLKADTLQKELSMLIRDASQILLPSPANEPLSHEEFLSMKNALEKIKKSPSSAEVEAAENSYQIVRAEASHLQDILNLLNEYITIRELLSKAIIFINKVKSQSQNSMNHGNHQSLLNTVKKIEQELNNKDHTLGKALDSLDSALMLYEYIKKQTEVELYKKEGSIGEKRAQYNQAKCELKKLTEKYAQCKASLLIIKGASMISTMMHNTVKEFKHMLLKRLNNKLQSLWNQCYAHAGDAQNEISTVRLAITQVGVGDKAKDVIELQAICDDINTGNPVVRSFRETCSSGQQVLLSILLRLSFSYISMSPFSFIVLDEPTNYLDKENSKNLAYVLADFISNEQNTQVIIITHSLEFCDALISATNNTNTRTYKVSMESEGSTIREIKWELDDDMTY